MSGKSATSVLWFCALIALVALGCSGAPDERVTLSFVGDVLLETKQSDQGKAPDGDRFAPSAALLDADFSIANLECPVATSGTVVEKVYTFRAAPSTLPALRAHFDAVSVANNHSGDYGVKAFGETLTRLRAAGVGYFGGGRDLSEAHAPLLLKKRGVTIALLGYDEFQPRSFEATPEQAGVAWAEEEQMVLDIQRSRQAGADVVLPFLHWGWENEPAPCARQRELARALIDAGASAVIGAHPHVTQGIEMYRGKPIVYSLGNFAFDLLDVPENALGWRLRLVVDRAGVVSFSTAAVHIDDAGTPFPLPSAVTPCGVRGARTISSCVGSEPR
jgi:poly-gamma-glutamate synthesis protein (capsule biosynthesis protein)